MKSIERETAYHGQCWSIFSQVSSIEKIRKLNNFNLKQAWTNLGCASMKKTRPALLTVEKCELLIESRYHWLKGFSSDLLIFVSIRKKKTVEAKNDGTGNL